MLGQLIQAMTGASLLTLADVNAKNDDGIIILANSGSLVANYEGKSYLFPHDPVEGKLNKQEATSVLITVGATDEAAQIDGRIQRNRKDLKVMLVGDKEAELAFEMFQAVEGELHEVLSLQGDDFNKFQAEQFLESLRYGMEAGK